MNKWVGITLRIIIGVGISVLGYYYANLLHLPIVGNQLAVLAAAYYIGPFSGLILALVAGVFIYFLNPNSLVCLFPVLVGAVLAGVLSKKRKYLDKFIGAVSLICMVSFAEGTVLAISEGIALKGSTILPYTDNIMAMLEHYSFPQFFCYFTAGLFATYLDVSLCFFILWILHYIKNPLKKKRERKKYLKRNMAGLGAILLAVMSLSFSAPMSAKASEDVNYITRIFNASNGLSGGAANDIAQTSDGTMWIATYEGLYKFNGKKFELITNIPSVRSTMCLFVAKDDSLWVGNNGTGLTVVKSDGNVIKLDVYDGMPSDSIRDIEQISDDTFYVATTKGLAIVAYDGESLAVVRVIDDNQYINQVEAASDGTIAFFSSDGVVYIAKNGIIYQKIQSEYGDITSVNFDQDDVLYIGKSNNRIYKYSRTEGIFEGAGVIDTGDIYAATKLCFTNELTYVAAQNGLGYIDKNDNFSPIYVDGFDSTLGNVIEDYQGNIWFTSSRKGILCMEKSVFMDVFSVCDVSECVTNTEIEWGGLLYVGTDTGLLALDLEKGTTVTNELTELYGIGYRIRCLMVDSNNSLWISVYGLGTVEVTDSGDIYTYSNEMGNFNLGPKARLSLEREDGTVVISHNGGIAFIKDHKITDQYICGEKMSSAYALSMVEKKNNTLLVGTDGEGILVYENGELTRTITRKEGISSGVVLRMVNDPFAEGTFVLTGSGLCYLDADYSAKEIEAFPYFNNIDMWVTENGSVFVLSSAGVFAGSYEELMNKENDFVLLDSSYGLSSSLTSNPWNYLSEDGKLFLAGSKGVYALDIDNYKISVNSFRPCVSGIQIDGEEIDIDGISNISIPSGNHKITFSMDINNFTSADPYVRYYLSGVDKAKNVCLYSELAEVTYENLSHGEYTFYVEVLNEDKETVVAKSSFSIVKGSEPYETAKFLIVFYLTLVWIAASLVVTIMNFSVSISVAKQKSNYDKVLTKLEREKAQALELALSHEEQANKSKSDFLASMSHEIRTPINAIIGMDTMILRETNQDSIKNYAHNVKSASETLLSLINDILDFSKIESGKMELVLDDYDIGSVINDLINMIRPKAENKGLDLIVSVDSDIPATLYGDSVRIKQIILNILNNAVKYTEKGHINLDMRSERVDDKQIALSVRISDTGIGIKEEDLHKLFSPYERIEENRNKNVEGTGLGMSITKNLLDLMNSSLCVESEYGKGSTFSFTILQPIRSEEVIGNFEERLNSIAANDVDIEAFHAPEAEILVVDDVEMNLIVAVSLLKRTQIKVVTASSGLEAIEKAKEKKFDVILLDSMMPEMSGEETLKIIKTDCEPNKETPVIVLTANAIKGAKEEYIKLGFDNYLSKPIEGNKLEAMLQSYLPAEKIITDFEKGSPADVAQGSDDVSNNAEQSPVSRLKAVDGIDVQKGIETAGGEEVYLVVCKNFYDTAKGRIEMLEKHFREMDIANYTIQVHALKSSAKLIGAFSLSEEALEMEMAGREENIDLINEKTDHIISEYRRILFEMDDIFGNADEDSDKPELSEKKLKRNLSDMLELVEAFDFSTASELFNSLSEYKLPLDFKESYKELRGRFAEVDHDGITEIINRYLQQ